MTIEPLGSLMTVQAQTYEPKQVERKTQEEVISPQVQVQEIEKTASIVKGLNKSELRKDKNNENRNNNLKEMTEEERQKLREYVKRANKKFMNSRAEFRIHEETNRIAIKIVDRETEEVIKEIPPEKFLDNLATRMELAGLFMDARK